MRLTSKVVFIIKMLKTTIRPLFVQFQTAFNDQITITECQYVLRLGIVSNLKTEISYEYNFETIKYVTHGHVASSKRNEKMKVFVNTRKKQARL